MKAGDKGLEGTMPVQGRFRAQDWGLLPRRPHSSGPAELGLLSKAGWMAIRDGGPLRVPLCRGRSRRWHHGDNWGGHPENVI